MDLFKILRKKEAKSIKKNVDYRETTAEDIMISPIFLYENDSIETIIDKLKKEDINYCIVINKKGEFLGEIIEEDLIKVIAHSSVNEPLVEILDIGYRRGINYTSVKNYIRKHKNIVQESTRLFEIMKLIDKKGFQYVPVVDKNNKVIGLITPSSILRFIINR